MHSKYKIHFCWTPSHVGIEANEIADKAAKAVATDQNVSITRRRVPHLDMKKPIREYIWNKWQQRWTSPLLKNNRKYRKVRPSVASWSSSYQSNRRYEKILTRLRIGHTRVTHSFIFEGSSPPECDHCGVPLTVEHILVDCTYLQEIRNLYHLDGKSIDSILGDDLCIDDVMDFLKDSDFYLKI